MRIAFPYGPWATGPRPFDFTRLLDDPRGLTGSEVSCFNMAKELARRHDVHLYATLINTPDPFEWNGIHLHKYDQWAADRGKYDAALAWNEPEQLRDVPATTARIVNQQLNDFSYCKPGFGDHIDVFTSPSQPHMEHMIAHWGFADKWVVLPNGCDPDAYPQMARIPGSVLYASSPDRGLHWLLQQWMEIRRRVPGANLRIFYNFDAWLRNVLPFHDSPNANLRECSHRAYYIQEALKRLAPHGVEHHKSISRNQMAQEMAQARVLAYPCDTITYTEGFSVTLMEACAAGVVPVTSRVDSLGRIYENVVPMVDAPVRDHLPEFTDLVVRGLTEESFRQDVVTKCIPFAQQHSWTILGARLESIVMSAVHRKKAA